MRTRKTVPVTLLTGYLGAGKTTLLNEVLANQKGYKVAVIVNDIGEVNIDAGLIAKGGQVSLGDNNLVPLQNGCICCTLQVDLINQIIDLISTGQFDYILIEASGICEPVPIAQSISMIDGSYKQSAKLCRLDNIVTVVDTARMADEFGCGEDLIDKELDEEDIENLLIQQIEFCNTIILNKVDTVTPQELAKVKAVVRALQPEARLIETNYAKVDISEILNTNRFDFESASASAGWVKLLEGYDEAEEGEHSKDTDLKSPDEDGHTHTGHGNEDDEGELHAREHDAREHGNDHDRKHEHNDENEHEHENDHEREHSEIEEDADNHKAEGHHHHHHHHHGEGEAEEYGIGTFVYYRRKPFDRAKLKAWLQLFPASVIRCKGIVWLSDDDTNAYMLEQAGRQIQVSDAGQWIATAPKRVRLKMMEEDPSIEKDWDPVLGDRMIKLVFIGRSMNKDAIVRSLDAALA